MKIFFDLEFTGLYQDTTPISIGLVAENGRTFYAEFIDYDRSRIDNWLRENVIPHLRFGDLKEGVEAWENYRDPNVVEVLSNKAGVISALTEWLSQFDQIEMWGDCLAYDWVLFYELFGGGAKCLPENVLYIPLDICTLFWIKGIDPDVDRGEFAQHGCPKHNALDDALITKICFEKLVK